MENGHDYDLVIGVFKTKEDAKHLASKEPNNLHTIEVWDILTGDCVTRMSQTKKTVYVWS